MTDEHDSESTTNDETGPPLPPTDEGDTPSPPPPPSASTSSPSQQSAGGDNRTVMVILAYLYFFCLVPLFVEKDDPDLQWHAKNGLLMLGADVLFAVVFTVLFAVPFLGCLLVPVWALVHFALFVLRIIAIVKGTQGERLIVPGLSPLADKF